MLYKEAIFGLRNFIMPSFDHILHRWNINLERQYYYDQNATMYLLYIDLREVVTIILMNDLLCIASNNES